MEQERRLTCVFVPDGKVISARVLELPGCFSEGNTFEEAISNLENAIQLWLSPAVEF